MFNIASIAKVYPREYEYSHEQPVEYKTRLGELLQSVYNIMASAKAFERCHALIKTAAASWTNMARNEVSFDSVEKYFDAEDEVYIYDLFSNQLWRGHG